VRAPTRKRIDPVDAAAFAAARAIVRREARGFHFAATLLRPTKRDGVCAVYALCLMLRDAMDDETSDLDGARGMRNHPAVVGQGSSCGSSGGCESRLNMFLERLDTICAGRLELPAPASRSEPQRALHAFAVTVARHHISREHFVDLAESYRRDLTRSRYATWSSVQSFCDGSGGAVALAMAEVLGVQHSDAHVYLRKLGAAIRFTELLRNVGRDRARGRVYLPLEDLARQRYSERELLAGTINEAWRDLMRFEIARARRMLRGGAKGICWLADDRSRLFAGAITLACAGVLDGIKDNNYDVFRRRVEPTAASHARRLPAAWRLARRAPEEPLPTF
jgi:phytoene/squalene synthetase